MSLKDKPNFAAAFSGADEEQPRILRAKLDAVNGHAWHMKAAVEQDNIKDALKHTTNMLKELSGSDLYPKNYSELYMEVFNKLNYLEMYLAEHVESGAATYDGLYETVQHAGHVLPRLYLMCVTAGSGMKRHPSMVPHLLSDLVEMCKGVQHPIRGLFLRSYLCSVAKQYLPDSSDAEEADAEGPGTSQSGGADSGSDVLVSIRFLLHNFVEMNKLWTRMQKMGGQVNVERRERERQELSDLVGKNLMYLSQLNGLDFKLYQELVLPKVTEQIVSCEDTIAQQYLMQCLMMAFPDEYHLNTLEALLSSCVALQPGVEIHSILSTLMERLAAYADNSEGPVPAMQGSHAFDCFLNAARSAGQKHVTMPAKDVIQMFLALTKFVAAVHGNDVFMLNQILEGCYDALQARGLITDRDGESLLIDMLHKPLEGFDISRVLALDKFPLLLSVLPPSKRRLVAASVVEAILKHGTTLSDIDQVNMLVQFISPLVHVEDEEPGALDDEDLEDNMTLVAKLVQHVSTPDLPDLIAILGALRDFVFHSAATAELYTIPIEALASRLLGTIRAEVRASNEQPSVSYAEMLEFYAKELVPCVEALQPRTALRMYLQGALVASEVVQSVEATERLLRLALELYDLHCGFQRDGVAGLQVIVNALLGIYILAPPQREALVEQVRRYASSLATRDAQVRLTCCVAHLYWQRERQRPCKHVFAASPDDDRVTHEEAELADNPHGSPVQAPYQNVSEVTNSLKRALLLAQRANNWFRPEKDVRDHPAPMYQDILDALIVLKARGCPGATEELTQEVITSIEALRGTEPMWTEQIAMRHTEALAQLS